MSQSPEPANQPPVTPSRRDRLRPLELIGFSFVLGLFAGLIVLMATRNIVLSLVFFGVGFIASVLMVALVGLGGKPSQEDIDARKDLRKPGEGDWH
ncbi:MAG: ABC transporter ATP-binding protein [Leucobacter sp.]